MSQDRSLQKLSYAAVFCGFLTLWVSGTFGLVATILYLGVMAAAWRLEGTKWQISERAGTVMIVLALPLFYLAWRMQVLPTRGAESAVAGILSRMILALSAVKLLQKKRDRDWVFLHLMTFFAVLLAAGLSISPLYLASFFLYVLAVVGTIIVWENDSASVRTWARRKLPQPGQSRPNWLRLAGISVSLLVITIVLAVPLFFMLPRVGGAGFGGTESSVRTYSGFSDTVRLGGIGKIQQSDRIVMRVETSPSQLAGVDAYYRGTAFDRFDGLGWSKSRPQNRETLVAENDGKILVDPAKPYAQLISQHIYLEPIDTPVLFAQPSVVEVVSGFSVLYNDSYGSFVYPRTGERVSYSVISDISRPTEEELEMDAAPYGPDAAAYLELPENYDKRIFALARSVTENKASRYEKAVAIRDLLRENYGYTLELKASGDDPLADFLFNIREGHCEYFSTAMVIMLRTQGVAARVVNGFHGGDFNSASGVTVVRELNAHSWVEVYFPEEGQWVTFDPTPAAGRNLGAGSYSGLSGQISKYLDALETVWIQYFVAFDSQGQAAVTRTFRSKMEDAGSAASAFLTEAASSLRSWWNDIRGGSGPEGVFRAAGYLVFFVCLVLLLIWLARKMPGFLKYLRDRRRKKFLAQSLEVSFAEELLGEFNALVSQKGYERLHSQTPLEFAEKLPFSEAIPITRLYNELRFMRSGIVLDAARSEARRLIASLKAELARPR